MLHFSASIQLSSFLFDSVPMESAQAESSSEPGPDFVSLGMVVLDELQFPNRSWLTNVPGGSGLYGVLSLVASGDFND